MADQFDFFQFDPGSLGNDWLGGSVATQLRPIGSRLSNYNASYIGTRNSSDYTRTVFQFSFNQNTKPELGVGFGVDVGYVEHNPYVLGSTVKRILDDQAFKMGMYHNTGVDLALPRHDVSDKKEVDASGMVSFKNYPTEGYASFGKKGDKAIQEAGNTWLRMP